MKRKIKKLFRSPGEYIRDYFLNIYPIVLSDRIPEKNDNIFLVNDKNLRWDNCIERVVLNDYLPVEFPIDFVFTHVSSDDIRFQTDFKEHYSNDYQNVTVDPARFECHEELRYALRSVFLYAPWVRKIHIVVPYDEPLWLDKTHPQISIVKHDRILPPYALPTFNSHVIESALHKIEGLSERYVYFNDDMLLARPTTPEYFFSGTGLAYTFLSSINLPIGSIDEKLDTPSEWGAKNARNLISNATGFYVSQMIAHTFYPQIKTISEENENRWQDEYKAMRMNKFRSTNDILCTGFLNPHMAILHNKSIPTRTRLFYFNIRHKVAIKYYLALLAKKGTEQAPMSFCLNDRLHDDGYGFTNFFNYEKDFLSAYFPDPAPWEKKNYL